MAVLNKHKLPNKEIPAGAVYIGRGSKWGNPFVMSDKPGFVPASSATNKWATLLMVCWPSGMVNPVGPSR